MTPFLDWQAFVPLPPRECVADFRVLKAYDAYRKGLAPEQSVGPGDAEALRVWEEEGGG